MSRSVFQRSSVRGPVRCLALGLLAAALACGCGGGGSSKTPTLAQQYQQALKIPDAEIRARRMVGIARGFVRQGDAIGADPALEAAAVATRNADRPVAQADLYLKIFEVRAAAGDAEHAGELLRDAIRITRSMEEPLDQFPLLIRLAKAYAVDLEKINSAKAALRQAEPLIESLPRQQQLGAKLRYGAALSLAGEDEQSQAQLDEALAALESVEDPRARCEGRGDAAVAMLELGREEDASQHLQSAKQDIAKLDSAESKAHAYLSLARKLLLAGELSELPGLLRQAGSAAEEVGDPSLRSSIMNEIDATRRLLE